MVKVAVVELVLPQESAAVKVTTVAPAAPPQASATVSTAWDQMTGPQRSEAEAPAKLSIHASYCSALPEPLHSTTKSIAGMSMLGASVSTTVTVWMWDVLFPQASATLQVRVSV